MKITTLQIPFSLFLIFLISCEATNCNNGWVNDGKRCYFTNSTFVVTYSEANKICETLGAEVLALKSTLDYNFPKLLGKNTAKWIKKTHNKISSNISCSVVHTNNSQILRKNVNCDLLFGFICQTKLKRESVNEEDVNCIKCHSNQRKKRYIDGNYPFQNRFHPIFSHINSNPPLYPPHVVFRMPRPIIATPPPPFRRHWNIETPEPLILNAKGDQFTNDKLHDIIANHLISGNRSISIRDIMRKHLKGKLIPPKDESVEDGELTTVSVVDEIKVSNFSKKSNNDSDVPLDSSELIEDNITSTTTSLPITTSTQTTSSTTTTSTTTTSTSTTSTSTTSSTPIPITCIGKNHFKFYGICYYFEDVKKKTWEEARKSCSSVESGSLASFNSKYEYESVLMILSSTKLIQSEIWIGFHVVNPSSSTQWNRQVIAQQSHWVNGDPILFPPWWQLELDISEGFCGAASEEVNNLWTLRNCQLVLPYLCSYKTDIIEFFEEATGCEYGWVEMDGWCYKYHHNLKTWRDAEESCIVLGGHLPSITGEKEKTILSSFLCKFGPPCTLDPQYLIFGHQTPIKLTDTSWVGYVIDQNGSAIWVDGINSNYQWDTDEPQKNYSNQYCGMIDDWTVKLSNHTCDSYLPYVCKRKPGHFTNVIPFVEEMTPIYCPNDTTKTWHRNGNSCYKVFIIDYFNLGKTFKEAMVHCNRLGAQLVSIESHEENYFILSQLTHVDRTNFEIWIAGKRDANDGKFYWMSENKNTLFQYLNWYKGEPNNHGNGEDCATIYPLLSGQWNDDHCAQTHGWICERSLNFSEEYVKNVLDPKSGSCPPYWTKIELKCVRFYSYEQRDYNDARELCSKHHVLGDLVTIENVKQQALITALLAVHKKRVWIGLRQVEDKFYWPDQDVVFNFTNWGKHQIPYHRTCVTLLTNGEFGKWDQTSCSSNSGYVCQMPVDPKLNATNLLPFQTHCTSPYDSFFYFEGDCYTIIEKAETWENAEKSCKKLGAHLTSVLLRKENSFLVAQFGNFAVDKVWIGLKQMLYIDRYTWSDHWPYLFSNWEDEHETKQDDNSCVTFSMKDGTWSQTNCNQLNFFICKRSKVSINSTELVPYSSCKTVEWMNFGGNSCYFFENNEKMPHDSAETFCKSLGGNLVSIHTHEDMNILSKLAEFTETAIWIGLKRHQDGAFRWSDDSPTLTYVNWATGEPNDKTELCVEMLAGSGLWNDLKCNLLRAVLCKAPKENFTIKGLPVVVEITHLSNNTGNILEAAEIIRSNSGRIIGINLSLLFVILVVTAAAAFGYNWYKRRSLLPSGGYGFDNVSYNFSNNGGPTNVVLGVDPLEHKYHESEGILGDQSEEDESDSDATQTAALTNCEKVKTED